MRLLLDTNIIAFILAERLDRNTKALLSDYSNEVFVSSVSMMEFIHLWKNGRVGMGKKRNIEPFSFVENEVGLQIKYFDRNCLKCFAALPLFPNHNDPVDRLIISQAIAEHLELVSTDTKFSQYTPFGLSFIQASHI